MCWGFSDFLGQGEINGNLMKFYSVVMANREECLFSNGSGSVCANKNNI